MRKFSVIIFKAIPARALTKFYIQQRRQTKCMLNGEHALIQMMKTLSNRQVGCNYLTLHWNIYQSYSSNGQGKLATPLIFTIKTLTKPSHINCSQLELLLTATVPNKRQSWNKMQADLKTCLSFLFLLINGKHVLVVGNSDDISVYYYANSIFLNNFWEAFGSEISTRVH